MFGDNSPGSEIPTRGVRSKRSGRLVQIPKRFRVSEYFEDDRDMEMDGEELKQDVNNFHQEEKVLRLKLEVEIPAGISSEVKQKINPKSVTHSSSFLKANRKRHRPIDSGQLEDTATVKLLGAPERLQDSDRGNLESVFSNNTKRGYSLEVKQFVSLQQCLRLFCAEEKLEDLVDCPKCPTSQPAMKQMRFSNLPTTLCLHLKRFRWTKRSKAKIRKKVEFPLKGLDMSPYMYPSSSETNTNSGGECSQGENSAQAGVGIDEKRAAGHGGDNKDSNIYDLVALVTHHGHSMRSGHYTAMANMDSSAGVWARYNDSSTSFLPDSKVENSEPYLLFYRQRGAHDC